MRLVIKKHHYKSRNKAYLLFLMLILMLSHKCFYMWLQDSYMFGSFKYSDISVVMSVLFTFAVLIQYGRPREKKIKKYIYIFLGLAIISAFTANIIHEQSFFRGLFAQRIQISYLLLFLGVERLFEKKIICKYDVERVIYLFCWVELLVCTIQYFYYTNTGNLFLIVGVGIRYEAARLYFDPGILLMVVFKSYFDLLTKKQNKIYNCAFVLWVAFFIIFITKMRAMTLAFLISLVVGLVIWKGALIKKVLIAFLGGFVAVKVLSRFAIIQDLMVAFTNLNADSNYNIRILGRTQFLGEFFKTPLTGRGYPSVNSSSSYSALKGYFFVDNGVFGLIYSYGILGIIWYICFWYDLVVKAWKIRKKELSYMLYFVYYLVGIMTDFAWFWTATCSFSIMIAMLLEDERKIKMEEQGKC